MHTSRGPSSLALRRYSSSSSGSGSGSGGGGGGDGGVCACVCACLRARACVYMKAHCMYVCVRVTEYNLSVYHLVSCVP